MPSISSPVGVIQLSITECSVDHSGYMTYVDVKIGVKRIALDARELFLDPIPTVSPRVSKRL
jgi:hypothetical protein